MTDEDKYSNTAVPITQSAERPLVFDTSTRTFTQIFALEEIIGHMISGTSANEASGVVLNHIGSFVQAARELNCIVMIRSVNPQATALIEQGYPTKPLDIKFKTEQGGSPIAGLIAAPEKANPVSSSQSDNKLIVPEVVRYRRGSMPAGLERENGAEGAQFKFREMGQGELKLFRRRGSAPGSSTVSEDTGWREVNVFTHKGFDKPITSDYDLFAILPKLGEIGIAGSEKFRYVMRGDQLGKGKFFSTAKGIMTLLGQRERRSAKGKLGILNDLEEQVIDRFNEAAKHAGYTGGKVIQHGTEQNNPKPIEDETQKIFIIMPDGRTCITEGFIQALAFMEAAKSKGYLCYENRAYTKDKPLILTDQNEQSVMVPRQKLKEAAIQYHGRVSPSTIALSPSKRSPFEKLLAIGESENAEKESCEAFLTKLLPEERMKLKRLIPYNLNDMIKSEWDGKGNLCGSTVIFSNDKGALIRKRGELILITKVEKDGLRIENDRVAGMSVQWNKEQRQVAKSRGRR